MFVKLRGYKQFPCHLIEGVVKQWVNVKNALNPVACWEDIQTIVVA
jgi:hypothetical protein